jgi:muconolactone delta-isomerase
LNAVHDHLERASAGFALERGAGLILEVFSPWRAPANFKIHSFVIRVGDWGDYMLMECDDPLEVHKFCSMLPAFRFEARPVVPVAIRAELEAIAYRDGLKSA